MRRDWPGWMLVTLDTLGVLTMVGRERLTPGTEGRDTETREEPGVTPALVTRPGDIGVKDNFSYKLHSDLLAVTALAESLASELVSS